MTTLPCLPAWVLCVALGLGGSSGSPAAPTTRPAASWAALELTWPGDAQPGDPDDGLCVSLALARRQVYAMCVRRPVAAPQGTRVPRTGAWRVSFLAGSPEAPRYCCVYTVLAIASAPAARTITAALPSVCAQPARPQASRCLAAQGHSLMLRLWI